MFLSEYQETSCLYTYAEYISLNCDFSEMRMAEHNFWLCSETTDNSLQGM